jgi:hypothetical protein
MAVVTTREVTQYLGQHAGQLVPLTNGNYDVRGPSGSANVGKPKNNRWDTAQFRRAWGDSTGIPKPDWA